MAKEVKLAKVIIRVGEKDLEFTPDEARQLRVILNGIFNEGQTEKVFIPVPYEVPVRPYVYPYWSVRWETSKDYNGTAIYLSTTGTDTV